WQNVVTKVLMAGGIVEQKLTQRFEILRTGMQQNLPNGFSDLCAPRFSCDHSGNVPLLQNLVKQSQLRGLPRTINAFKGDKKIHVDGQRSTREEECKGPANRRKPSTKEQGEQARPRGLKERFRYFEKAS